MFQQLLGNDAQTKLWEHYFGITPRHKLRIYNPFTLSNSKTFVFLEKTMNSFVYLDKSPKRAHYKGNIITAVAEKFGTTTSNAYHKIIEDFSLDIGFGPTFYSNEGNLIKPTSNRLLQRPKLLIKKTPVKIRYERQDYTPTDLRWFFKYKIAPSVAKYYKFNSARRVFFKDAVWNRASVGKPLFVYHCEDRVKAYYPESSVGGFKKWCSNMTDDHIVDIDKLPEFVDEVVLCSSKKDGLVVATHGYHQVSAASEFASDAFKTLAQRANKVLVFFDADEAGRTATADLCEMYDNFVPIFWDSAHKDISDFSKHTNAHATRELLRELLGKPTITWTKCSSP